MQRVLWNVTDRSLEIIAASCEHEGSIMCHEAGLEKTIDYIAEKPNRFLIKLGDNIEAIATNDKRYNQPPTGMKEKEAHAKELMLTSSQRRCGELEDMNALLKVELEKAIRGGYVMEGEDAGLIELDAPELFSRSDSPLSEKTKENLRREANAETLRNQI